VQNLVMAWFFKLWKDIISSHTAELSWPCQTARIMCEVIIQGCSFVVRHVPEMMDPRAAICCKAMICTFNSGNGRRHGALCGL
jgi:hypothetical protein